MSAKELLQPALKEAMKAKNKVALDTIRGLMSAIQYEELEKKQEPLSAEQVVNVYQREIKKRRESIEFEKQASRAEQVSLLESEIQVIEAFLPKQLSEAELRSALEAFKAENPEAKGMGPAMKYLKDKHAGRYDSKMASELTKQLFS